MKFAVAVVLFAAVLGAAAPVQGHGQAPLRKLLAEAETPAASSNITDVLNSTVSSVADQLSQSSQAIAQSLADAVGNATERVRDVFNATAADGKKDGGLFSSEKNGTALADAARDGLDRAAETGSQIFEAIAEVGKQVVNATSSVKKAIKEQKVQDGAAEDERKGGLPGLLDRLFSGFRRSNNSTARAAPTRLPRNKTAIARAAAGAPAPAPAQAAPSVALSAAEALRQPEPQPQPKKVAAVQGEQEGVREITIAGRR